MNKMTKRLNIIASLVDKKIVADVGCDHGKLLYYLLDKKIINFGYASDISRDSLQKAIDLIGKKYNNFEAICCDGLSSFKNKFVEQCVISGMGGDEIIKIIKNSPIEIDSYILSPQHNVLEVKKFMISLDYNISFDIIIEDKGKYYSIIKFDKDTEILPFTELELYFGRDSFTSCLSDVDGYIEYNLNKNYELLNKVNGTKKDIILKEIELLKKAKKERNKNE